MDTKPSSTSHSQGFGGCRHEAKDASVGWIFGIVLFLLACAAVIQLEVHGLLTHLTHSPEEVDAWRPGRIKANTADSSFPRLQVAPALDLRQFQMRQDDELTNYGWIDRSAGVVRIPIDRAMDLLLRRGFPVRTNVEAAIRSSPVELILERSTQRQPSTPKQE